MLPNSPPEQLVATLRAISRPSPDKWRASASDIEAVWPVVEQADTRARAFLDRFKV